MMYLFENDFLAFCPEIYLFSATSFLLIYGTTISTSKEYNYPSLVLPIGRLAVLTLFFSSLLLMNNPIQHSLIFLNVLVLDDLTFYFKFILLGSALCAILISLDYFQQERLVAFEYIVLMLFSCGSMLCMISCNDLLSLYLSIEFQSLSFYVLAASKRNSEFSTEAGLKYFILGAFSSGILLFGSSLVYGLTGVTNFGDLSQVFTGMHFEISSGLNPNHGVILGILLIGFGFLFKLTAAPFHMWAPDVYEGSPTAITAFFSITPKIALFGVFIRFFFCAVYDLISPWMQMIIVCSFLSMCVGAFAALSQYKIKRLLAYSSIGHVGYLLLGISSASIEGIEAFWIYLCVYLVMTLNLFTVLLSLVSPRIFGIEQSDDSLGRIRYLSDLGMLSRTNPVLAFTLTCTLFSMAGIPPLAGFVSKFVVFFAALGSSLYFMAVIGVLTSVVSSFYYIRLIKIMYFEKASGWIVYEEIDRVKSILLGITLFCMLFFFIYPSPLFLIGHKLALSISL